MPSRILIAYGLPALPAAVLGLPLLLYLPTFYAVDLGLGFTIVGAVLLLARVVDVIADPIIGWASDRFDFGLGRRRSWLLLSLPLVLIGVMYFLMIRPQMKRQKEHRAMLDKLGVGDEVITNGGIAGVVREIGDSFLLVEIAADTRVRVQKGAIANVLPKGSLKSA